MIKKNDILWYFYYSAWVGWEYMILEVKNVMTTNIYGCLSVSVNSIVGKTITRINLPIGNYDKLVSSGKEYYTTNQDVAVNFIRTHIANGE